MSNAETLRVLAVKHVWFDATRCVIPEFEKATGLKVVIDYIHDEWEMYEQSKKRITAAATAYDAFMVDSIWIYEYVKAGMLACFEPELLGTLPPDYDFTDLIPQYVRGFCQVNDRLYALPLGGHTNFLAYRKDLLQERGLKPPATQAELLECAKALHTDKLAGITCRGRGFELAYTYMLFLYPNGGQVLDENCRPCLDTDAAAATLDYLVKLWKYTPPDVFGYSYPDMVGAFINGKTAFYSDASMGAEIQQRSPHAAQIGYGLAPKGRMISTSIAGWSMGIPAASPRKREAFHYLQLMTSKKYDADALRAGREPLRLSTMRDAKLNAQYPFLAVIDENLKHAQPWFRPPIPELAGVLDTLGRHLALVLAGKCEAQVGLAAAQREIAGFLARAAM